MKSLDCFVATLLAMTGINCKLRIAVIACLVLLFGCFAVLLFGCLDSCGQDGALQYGIRSGDFFLFEYKGDV
jgi:hypothetical protein